MIQRHLHDLFFDEEDEFTITERNLPHWKQDGKLYFITWHQTDSLPQELLEQLAADRAAWMREYGDRPLHTLPLPLRREYHRLFHHQVETWLDAGHGSCMLRRSDARRIMIEAFHHFHRKRYQLGSFAVAGNHVHVLVAPYPSVDLSGVLHSWKSFTANAINKAVGRSGRLWMDENFDRLIRNEMHLERVEDYIAGHVHQGAYVERRRIS